MQNAKLYEVQLPRGEVYALHDLSTGTIWTERSEKVARQIAVEKGLAITHEQTISHEQLLRLLGHEPPAKPAVATAAAEPARAEPMSESALPAPVKPLTNEPVVQLPFPVRYHLEDEPADVMGDALVISRTTSPKVKSIFCLEKEIATPTPLQAASGAKGA